MVIGEVARYWQPGARVVNGLFLQGHADAHDHATGDLAAAGLRD